MDSTETNQTNGIVLDLSVLHGKPVDVIASRVGRRGIILPMASFTDTIVAPDSRLGSREARIRKLWSKLRTLVFEAKLPIRIPDWNDGREVAIQPIQFLSHDAAEIVRMAENRVEDFVASFKPTALRFEAAQRHRVSGEIEFAAPVASWLYDWAVRRVDESKGQLARLLAECFVGAGCRDHNEPYRRAIAAVGCVDFLHKYGRRANLPGQEDLRAMSDFHDMVYLIWALRFDAYLWTADKTLNNLCTLAKKAWRIAGLGQT